jgi:flagellar biosynthesis/type III secretory pathway M-ring protein FliF/YscJ
MTLLETIKRVLVSWQVIAVTVVLILYWFLVSYTASARKRRPAPDPKTAKQKRPKRPKQEKPDVEKDVDTSGVDV